MGQVSGIHRKAFNSFLSGKKCQDGEISKKKKKKCKIRSEINQGKEQVEAREASQAGPKPFCSEHRWI